MRRRLLALAVVAGSVVAAGPVAAGEPVEDSLITSVPGYSLEPESETFGEGSGPMSVADLAELQGLDTEDLPTGLDGYIRVFTSPSGDSIALAGALDLGNHREARAFLDGYVEAAEEQGGEATPLFPGDERLGDLDAYSVTIDGVSVLATGFASAELGVFLQVVGADDPLPTLQDMTREQAKLTRPTTAQPDDDDPDTDSVAYKFGYALGIVLVLGVILGIPTLLLVLFIRSRNRTRAGTPFHPPPWSPPPPPGYNPPPQHPPWTPPPPPPPPAPPPPPPPPDWPQPR